MCSPISLRFAQRPALVSRSVAGAISVFLYFFALRSIPLSHAVLLNNTSPVLTALGAVLVLGERPSWLKAACLMVSMAGVWLLLQTDGGGPIGIGTWAAAASAVTAAWALVSLKVATRENRSVIVVWSLAAVGTVASAVAGLAQGDWVQPDWRDACLMAGTGVLSGAAQLLATAGYRAMDASEAAVRAST